MHLQLKEILTHKRKEIADLRKKGTRAHTQEVPLPLRDFKGALCSHEQIDVIAEIKFASPSAGPIREKTDPFSIGRIYEEAGAASISLLTDAHFFKGDIRNLPYLKKSVSLPILRKDFILDPCQVMESFAYGADGVLLIARILPGLQLKELMDCTREFGMSCLTEVHDIIDLERALDGGADIIGINNRNLDTFTVDLGTTVQLSRLIPGDRTVVSESGISSGGDMRLLKKVGVDAVLVGTHLMRSPNLREATEALVHSGNGRRAAIW